MEFERNWERENRQGGRNQKNGGGIQREQRGREKLRGKESDIIQQLPNPLGFSLLGF